LDERRYLPVTRAEHNARLALRALPAAVVIAYVWIGFFVAPKLVPSPWLVVMAVIGLVAYASTLRQRGERAAKEIAERHARARALGEAEKLDEAGAELDAMLDLARYSPSIHCAALVQRALLFARRGDTARALSILHAVRDSRWLEHPKLQSGRVALEKALAGLEGKG